MPRMLRTAVGVAAAMLVLEIVLRHGDGIFLVALISIILIVVIQACALGAPWSRGATAALIAVSIVILIVFLVFGLLFSFPVIHYWRNDLGTLDNVAAWALVAAPTGTISGIVFGTMIGLVQIPALAKKRGWWLLVNVLGSVLDGLIIGALYWAEYRAGVTVGSPPARYLETAQVLIMVLALVAATGVFRGILTTLVLVRVRKEQAEMASVATEQS